MWQTPFCKILFPFFNLPVWKCENLVLSIKELVRNETKCKLVFPQARISYKRQSSTEQCWRGLNRLKNAKWNATEGQNTMEKSEGRGNSDLMPLRLGSCCFLLMIFFTKKLKCFVLSLNYFFYLSQPPRGCEGSIYFDCWFRLFRLKFRLATSSFISWM